MPPGDVMNEKWPGVLSSLALDRVTQVASSRVIPAGLANAYHITLDNWHHTQIVLPLK